MNFKENIGVILNPISGRHKNEKYSEIIKSYFKNSKNITLVHTKHKGHAFDLANEFVNKGYEIILAIGGDGTINEVASAIVNTNVKLGILPAGSGNGLARSLGIPVDTKKALNIISRLNTKKIDCGKANKKYFFCTCGIGFDAQVGKKFEKLNKRGLINYIKASIKTFSQYKAKKYSIVIDTKKIKKRAFLISIANTPQYGNNAYIAPNAKVDDNLLDICILKSFPKKKILLLALKLFTKNIQKSKYVKVFKGKKIIVVCKKKMKIHLDGEPIKSKKQIEVKIVPSQLNVIVP